MIKKLYSKKRSLKAISFWGILSIIIFAMLFNSVIGYDRPLIDMEITPFEINETDELITNVSLIQSTKEKAFDITEDDVREMVREAVELAGGLDGIVKDGDTVVLKPNFLTSSHKSGNIFSMIMNVICADGKSRLARIPGRMKRRMKVRAGDLLIIQPWEIQDEKADVVYRYFKTQSSILSRRNLIPEVIDVF